MYWNHRIVHKDGDYGIHEVDYNDNGEILCITVDPVAVFAESADTLHEVLDMMKDDITKKSQVLEYEKESKLASAAWEKEYGGSSRRKNHESTLDKL